MTVRYLREDGCFTNDPLSPQGLPARDYVLPEGVRISIQEKRPYKKGVNKTIKGSVGGFARLMVVDPYNDAGRGGSVKVSAYTNIEILANTTTEAYELYDLVDQAMGAEIFSPRYARACFSDLWQELLGYVLVSFRQWQELRTPWRRELIKASKRFKKAITAYEKGRSDLNSGLMPAFKTLGKDIDRIAAMIPTPEANTPKAE